MNSTNFYSNDKSTQIVLALLKAHGIKKVVASPGTTNIALVASMQYDTWFEMYSSVDERSAAYMACGLASESGEPVVITCTEATASRNYYPGLTEAHYRKLPILAITGTHGDEVTGHLNAQSIDRSQTPRDTVNFNVSVGKIKDRCDEWLCVINVNKAILELRRNGGGPVLINLHEATGDGFDTRILPSVRKIERILTKDSFPNIENSYSVAVFVGSHKVFSDEETLAIETFCERYNGVVFVDHTSNYYGKYKVFNALLACQNDQRLMKHPSLVIHIG
ncbi:thiamine pyrophosphate-binding protein, partial [Prevotella pectinovora]